MPVREANHRRPQPIAIYNTVPKPRVADPYAGGGPNGIRKVAQFGTEWHSEHVFLA